MIEVRVYDKDKGQLKRKMRIKNPEKIKYWRKMAKLSSNFFYDEVKIIERGED